MLVGTFLGPLGGIIVAVALPTIASDFGLDLATAKWVLLVYQLCTTFLLPVIGRLGQRFGEGRLFLFGFGLDALGTLGSALVPAGALWMLLATRVLQAVGSACLFALFSGLVARIVPPEKRGLAFGLIGATVAVSLVIAPPLGGILCQELGWRWVFLIQLPLHLLGLIRGWQLLPRDPLGVARPLPLLSLPLWLVIVGGLVFCAEALERNWATQYLGIALAAVLTALAAFVIAERGAQPLFHYGLFRLRAFWLGALSTLVLNLSFSAMILLVPLYLENYLGYDSRRAGMLLCLSPLLTLFTAPLAGMLGDRIGARLPGVLGFAAGAAGFACMAGGGLEQTGLLALGLALLGVSGGLINGPVIAAMMATAGGAERSEASSMNSLARNIGFVSGTALCSLMLALQLGSTPQPLRRGAEGIWQKPAAYELQGFQSAAGNVLWGCAGLLGVLGLGFLSFPRRTSVAQSQLAGS